MPPLPPRALGELIIALGGGRRVASDTVDPAVGLELLPRAGQHVEGSEVIAIVHARTASDADAAESSLRRAIDVAWQDRVEPLPLLVERITATDTTPWNEVR
jgi:thymidine phosphorylase